MRVFSICLRASLMAVALTCLAAVASGQQVPVHPAGTPANTGWPNMDGDGGSVPDPMRSRSSRNSRGSEFALRRLPARPEERKLTDAQKRRLYPSATEKAAFAAILRKDGTGMTRLLPFCDLDQRIVDVRGSCADGLPLIPGRGSFYSFKTENHEARSSSDLWLNNNEFRVGFGEHAVGAIKTLGDVPLDALTLQSSAVAPLLLLAPAGTLDETVKIYERSRPALASAQPAYGTTSPAQLNTTYVMRSTVYQPKARKPTDAIVAFRVTRQDTDGSVTIVWKQLRAPKG